MTKKSATPPLPQKGGSYTVDSRNRLKKVEDDKVDAPAQTQTDVQSEDVSDA